MPKRNAWRNQARTGCRNPGQKPGRVSGLRPQGVLTTGALQQFIYALGLKPFRRAVVVGTELVSFPALWTMRRHGIKPLAMIKQGHRIKAYWPATLFARLLGVPINYDSHVVDMFGIDQLSAIKIVNTDGKIRTLSCDGLIFSGNFTADNNLARASHLILNPDNQIPLTDQNWQSSDPDMGEQCSKKA